jgi:methylmalonyl-CoA mutase N-terminal domain/subunit
VRVALQAMAAVLGGTQSLHTNGQDEALSLPSETAARVALRTQQVIGFESGVTAAADPLGGSEYVEKLTDEIEAGALEYLERIEARGGTLAAIESGYIQGEIQNAAYQYQKAVEEGRQIVVGVNRFQSQESELPPPFRIEARLEQEQVERVRAVRASRSAGAVDEALARLEQAARGTENLLPRILEACRAQATVGEISDTLRRVFGEYRETF